MAVPAFALPANPERPLAAQTCDAALIRLAEAQVGSPLISSDTQAHVLQSAHADAVRLCRADQIDGHLPEGSAPHDMPPDHPEKV